jgi:hypothetical protein
MIHFILHHFMSYFIWLCFKNVQLLYHYFMYFIVHYFVNSHKKKAGRYSILLFFFQIVGVDCVVFIQKNDLDRRNRTLKIRANNESFSSRIVIIENCNYSVSFILFSTFLWLMCVCMCVCVVFVCLFLFFVCLCVWLLFFLLHGFLYTVFCMCS